MNTPNFKGLTKIERERAAKRLRGEQEELIDTLGQDSDLKAKGAVQEYVKEQEALARKQFDDDFESLKLLSNNKRDYQRYLLRIFNRNLVEENIPKKFKIFADSNDLGIAVGIVGTSRVGAFKVCGDPFYDINAVKVLAVQIGNTVAKLQGYRPTTQGGIILTDKEDRAAYGRNKK